MTPSVMLVKRILLYVLLVMLAQSNHQVYGFDATKCTVEIQVKRHSQYKINTGSSLIMECPVLYCKEKPFMEWCKMEEARCVQLKKGKPEWKSNVFTLKLSSVHQNDSGHYRCRAIVGNFSSESHGIKVIVEEKSANIITISPENTTSVSEESQKFGNYKILHIIFASVSMGLSCPFIIICMFCLRRHHAKQKRSSLTPQRQESLVRSSAAAPSHTVGTTHASEESSSLYYCSMASPMQAFLKNTIYDNDVPPWNTERTAPKEPHNDSAAPSIPVLLESPDALTYAALNHAASAERCQRRELTVENDFTEYACINVNK